MTLVVMICIQENNMINAITMEAPIAKDVKRVRGRITADHMWIKTSNLNGGNCVLSKKVKNANVRKIVNVQNK